MAGVQQAVAAPAPGFRPRAITGRVLAWYDEHARDLPWRRPEATPWAILVSEFMLQQTPVERVRGPWQAWLDRWPTPEALAAATPGDAVRAWGRLGYPRRALRLHQAATVITERFGGAVPSSVAELRTLPGVGSYTAAAIASFAYGRRELVLDTNVRRVLSRVVLGTELPPATPTRVEFAAADRLAPRDPQRAARWAVASMELGALVCRARTPRCSSCPIRDLCAWRLAGSPALARPSRRAQAYAGTDRQCRGALLAVLRSNDQPVGSSGLAQAWADAPQRARALQSLLADGLVIELAGGRWALPD